MKKNILVLISLLGCFVFNASAKNDDQAVVNSQESDESQKNSWGAKIKESNFHLGIDLQTKYVWRGMEMMTENSAPVVFPQLNYQFKGLYVYAMGGYSMNGKYAEVDLGASYTYKWFGVSINDYYYPTIDSNKDEYFNFKKNKTGHWLEGAITIAPEKIPLKLTVSNFFAGADKNLEGKQSFSTYAELGTWYDFLKNNQIAVNLGTAFNESCYNGYEHGIGLCNIEAKYTYNVELKNDWSFPIGVSYIINPIYEKSFVNCTINLAF